MCYGIFNRGVKNFMKRIMSVMLTLMVLFSYTGTAYAIQETKGAAAKLQAAPNARTIDLAFVFVLFLCVISTRHKA